jgi:hypothetical protein
MKLWIDDVRPAPKEYVWYQSVNEAKENIPILEKLFDSACRSVRYHFAHGNGLAVEEYLSEAKSHKIELIDIDHDAGDYAKDGGDYIGVLQELERLSRKVNYVNGVAFHNFWHLQCQNITFRLHSMNPVGVQNMRAILERNNWKEVYY